MMQCALGLIAPYAGYIWPNHTVHRTLRDKAAQRKCPLTLGQPMLLRRFLLPIALFSAMNPSMAADFSSPEGALKALEYAYVRKDIEAAVAAKDFKFEAHEMLKTLKKLGNPGEDLIKQTAEVLELSFRKQMKTEGFPAFADLKCKVVRKKYIRDGIIEMVEECIFPDGGKSSDTLHAAKSVSGWRIVVLP
jgi:hypothetical protein